MAGINQQGETWHGSRQAEADDDDQVQVSSEQGTNRAGPLQIRIGERTQALAMLSLFASLF